MSTDTSTDVQPAPLGPVEAVLRANDLNDPGLRVGIRAALGESGFDERDRYEAFGWEVDPDEEEYVGLYLRNPYGGGLIDKAVQLAWRHNPDIKERDSGDDTTEFEERVEKLARNLDFWTYCTRTGKAAGFGEYALLFINFDDVQDLGHLDREVDLSEGASLDDIRGFRVIPQFAVDEVEHGDFDSDRWGEPEYYHVDWGEDIDDDLDDTEQSSRVHHSRVVEAPSKPPITEEYQSRPRMERWLNTLYDIEKLLGSAAEMSYRGADKGLHINYDPTKVDPSALDTDQTKQDIQEWLHGLQPTLNTVGAEVNDLGGDIRDPTGALEAELKSLSAATGFSKQFIEGAAAGEIASSETNMRKDFGEIRERQQQYHTPYLVRRGLQTLIDAGVLPQPAMGFDVEWPDLFELSDKEEAEVEQKRSQTAKNLGLLGEPAQEYVATGEFQNEDLAPMAPIDESDREVAAQFDQGQQPATSQETSTTTGNATRYEPGNEVSTPQGVGVVTAVATETIESDDLEESIDASPDSPTYMVVVEDARVGAEFYKASEIHSTEIQTDVDPTETLAEEQSANSVVQAVLDTLTANDFSPPRSWRQSETPARIIALKAFAGMNGTFDGCVREMRGSVRSPDRFCGSFLDYVVGNPFWRGDSPLPGE